MPQPYQALERCILGALLSLLVWLPLPLGSNRDWSLAFFCFVTALLAASWALLQLKRQRPLGSSFRHALLPLGLLALVQLWVAIQWLGGLSRDAGASAQYFLLGCTYCLLYLLVIGVFRTRKRLTLLISVLVVSGTFQAFFGSAMTLSGVERLLFGPKDYHIGHATGTFVNRNHLAGYLEMTLAIGIGLLLALRQIGQFHWVSVLETLMGPKARLRLALVIMVIGLVMSHSRMGNTAFFGSLMLVGALFLLLHKENRLRNGLIFASLVLVDVLVVSQYFGLDELKDRLVNTRLNDVVEQGEVVQKANELRGDVYALALPLAQDRPIIGQGAGSFESVFPPYAMGLPLHFDHAHNDYLQFFIEYGAIGCIPLALFVLISLYYALKAMRHKDSVYRNGIGFGAGMGILALLIHSTTDFNLQIPSNAATFVVLCAIAVLANHHLVDRRQKQRPA